jgi:hypothetical protein
MANSIPAQHSPAATVTPPHAAANSVAANQKESQPQPAAKSRVPVDTVHISTAAQSALQEASESQVQTAKDARGGDRQAQRLLAKETAAKKA